ncbi:MAG: SAM-dependent methyltransferase [Betaproteobacteria bacterium]
MLSAFPSALAPSTLALAHSARLVDLIAREIQRSGWITFARYMDLALYAPGLGYYSGGSTKFGGAGDFVTAPEISPLFSQLLACQVAQVLRVTGGDVLELGAGSGRMAADVLASLDEMEQLPRRYLILEVSAELRARQQERLAELPHHLRERVHWIDALPDTFSGVGLANEVLDALPTHVVAWEDEHIFERGVGCQNRTLVWEQRELAAGPLRTRALEIHAASPYISEINLNAPALVRSLAAMLQQGVLLFIDYGFGAAELYHPQRSQGTLMCHFRHRAHDDPFNLPGLQDITSHVDFSAIAHAGVAAGMDLLGYTTQAQFLINLGITDLLAQTPATDVVTYAPLAGQAHKLLSPAEMGELFKVIALARGVEPALQGFQAGDKSRLL